MTRWGRRIGVILDNSAIFNGRYKCIKKIGQGGMSLVYLCVDQNIHQKWAVKIIPNAKQKDNFTSVSSEITLLKSLDYYMFPRITDAFIEKDHIGIVTDYIEGETLDSYLKREGPMPVNTALRYFKELLHAMEYLHSLTPGILYLDMKPENIMMRPDGEIRLIDFGIASSILLKGRSLGTLGYSPPEQYVAGAILSEKADVFALAMTLYTMLTGKRPKKELASQIEYIRKEKNIPHFLKELIISCVNTNPEIRPSVSDILRIINNKFKAEKGLFPTVLICVLVMSTLAGTVALSAHIYRQKKYEIYRNEMILRASNYIENGEFTKGGLNIISSYLCGDYLDEDTKDLYTFEIAKNYFEVQKDYASAQYYFKKLNKEKYPQVEEYLILCERMRGFNSEDDRLVMLMQDEIDDRKERVYE